MLNIFLSCHCSVMHCVLLSPVKIWSYSYISWDAEMFLGCAVIHFHYWVICIVFATLITCKWIIILKVLHTIVSGGRTECEEGPSGIRPFTNISFPSNTECVREARLEVPENETGFVCCHFMVVWEKEWRYRRKKKWSKC